MDTLPSIIQADPKRLKTVKDRTQSVRLLTRDRHIRLFVTYTKEGMKKRSPQEQAIFQKETSNRHNIGLKDLHLSCPTIPANLSGATYILELANGEKLSFP